ncbi:17-beta-hydroxysteroid dehydrogenase 14-like [Ruditapes philippinarum]|uniref:17-beta-hydroxysteroid dehydrogenase 14-like n=1 Tax=Ruditapes philippinarum TaxID=129788 RepID=UPI00295B6711|nr:17-beta-hydroxysteroid dehydrogenase 14-like [Ruditapes philippinarum]
MASGLRFKDKVAIITGGCSGIGKGCVEVFVENGGTVVVFDINDKVGNTLSIPGPGNVSYIHCDVTNEEEIKKSIDWTVEKHSKIDCLINDVGIHHGNHLIDELTVDSFRQILNVNVVSMFAMCKYALPHLRKTKGSIVNMSSFSGTNAQAETPTYCSSKGVIIPLSKALAIDEAKNGVRVNTCANDNDGVVDVENGGGSDSRGCDGTSGDDDCNVNADYDVAVDTAGGCVDATEATFTTGAKLMCTGGCEIGIGVK